MPYPGLLHPEPLPLQQAILTRTSSGDTQTQFWLSLCGLGVRFAPFPDVGSSDDQVFGEPLSPVGCAS